MQKKIFLTESVKKQILADKEKAIIESFAKNFNKIKRLDEAEVPPAGAPAPQAPAQPDPKNINTINSFIKPFADKYGYEIYNKVAYGKEVQDLITQQKGQLPNNGVIIYASAPTPQGLYILGKDRESVNNFRMELNNQGTYVFDSGDNWEQMGVYVSWNNITPKQAPQQQAPNGNEVSEDWKTNLAAGLATAAGGMGAQAQQHQQAPQAHQQTVQTSNDLNSVVSRGGAELGGRLLKAYKANPKAAEQWGAKHRNTAILDNIKSAANFQNNPKDVANLGDMYSGKGSTSLQDVVSFLTATESNAYSFE